MQKSHNIYILSNFQDEPFTLLTTLHPFIKAAKGEIVSARVHLKKPEKEIYELLLSTYNLNPKETLFIDDLKENIEASESVGIKGVHFTGPESLKTVEALL